jgi:hypothetical protein
LRKTANILKHTAECEEAKSLFGSGWFNYKKKTVMFSDAPKTILDTHLFITALKILE